VAGCAEDGSEEKENRLWRRMLGARMASQKGHLGKHLGWLGGGKGGVRAERTVEELSGNRKKKRNIEELGGRVTDR